MAVNPSSWRDGLAVARSLNQRGQYGEASEAVAAALARAERAYLPEIELADVLTEAGLLYVESGDVNRAKHALSRAMVLWNRQPEAYLGQIRVANAMVTVRIEAQEFREARKLAQYIIAECGTALDRFPLERVHALHNLANINYLQGRNREAEAMLREGLATLAQDRLGDTTEKVQMTLRLAEVLARRGDPETALQYARGAREDAEQVFGPTHPLVGRALIAEAAVNRSLRRNAEANVSVQRALAILPAASRTLQEAAWYEYASVLRQAGRKREAKSAEEHAKAIRAELNLDLRSTVDASSFSSGR